ncbi:superoxide dismutase family protein [Woodsholea maritima]|uniref:superoxide dismutase family protein n=1 Tax=Woodsholea maritima TaxID=240237 RepID=UPI00035E33F2|nr:superoxide dismutase family protein [Woodsholea maritima]
MIRSLTITALSALALGACDNGQEPTQAQTAPASEAQSPQSEDHAAIQQPVYDADAMSEEPAAMSHDASQPALAAQQSATPPRFTPGDTLALSLITNDGSEIGQAQITQGSTGVLIRIEARGLTPGWHGAHLHKIGDCSSSDFTSSGGHINPTGASHGLLNPNGPDAADLPNLFVHEDGSLKAEVFTPMLALSEDGGLPILLDEDGSALVIHANSDDGTTQPIGGAGARVACGVISAHGE